jgi:hypothetical protein
MKSKLNLSSYGVEELSQQEMLYVEGGNSLLRKAAEYIVHAIASGVIYELFVAVCDCASQCFEAYSETYSKYEDDIIANTMRGH